MCSRAVVAVIDLSFMLTGIKVAISVSVLIIFKLRPDEHFCQLFIILFKM